VSSRTFVIYVDIRDCGSHTVKSNCGVLRCDVTAQSCENFRQGQEVKGSTGYALLASICHKRLLARFELLKKRLELYAQYKILVAGR